MIEKLATGRGWSGWIASMLMATWCLCGVLVHAVYAEDAKSQALPSTTTSTTSSPALKANNIAVITIHGPIDVDRFGRSVMASSVERRIKTAARAGADAIVFDIDCPGGAVNAVIQISKIIKESPVKRTIAWIHPQALSGGAIIAIACSEILASDPAMFGDAMPIGIGASGMQTIPNDELIAKVLPPLVSDILDSCRRLNESQQAYVRDEYLAQAMAINDMELWWIRNKDTGKRMAIDRAEFLMLFPGLRPDGPTRLAGSGFGKGTNQLPTPGPSSGPSSGPASGAASGSKKMAELVASAQYKEQMANARPSSRPGLTPADAGKWVLIDKILDGTAPATFSASDLAHYGMASNAVPTADGNSALIDPVKTDEDLAKHYGAGHVRRLDRSWAEGIILILTNPIVQGLLIAIFLIAVFVEMTHPGVTLPGVVAIIALALLVGPPLMIGLASWLEVGAILAGLVLLGLEVFVIPGFGVAGVLGLMLLFGGLIGVFMPAGSGLFPSDSAGQTRLVWSMTTILAAVASAGLAMYFIAKHFGSVPLLNRLVLKNPVADDDTLDTSMLSGLDTEDSARLGDVGVTLTPMHPSGRIEVVTTPGAASGAVIDAVCETGFLPAGTKVRVVSVDGIKVGVEPV